MAQTEGIVNQPERGGAGAPRPARGRKHGILITAIVLLIVAGIVVGGIVPRLRAKAALKSETYDLAVPTVNVARPKQGAPAVGNRSAGKHAGFHRLPDLCAYERLPEKVVRGYWRAREGRAIARRNRNAGS